MKFTFRIQLQTEEQNNQEKLVIAGSQGEMDWHIALKLLAYLMFFKEKLVIEQSIGWHYKPDLFALDEYQELKIWIDCGNIEIKKIDKLATKIGTSRQFYIFRKNQKDMSRLQQNIQKKVKHAKRVKLVCFEDNFVDSLSEQLDVTNEISCQLNSKDINISLTNRSGEFHFQSKIYTVSGNGEAQKF